jgi:signal transduction histidine kinase
VTRRLLLGYLGAALIVLLVLEIPLGIFYQERETSRLKVDVERDATVLASYYEEPLEQGAALEPAPAEAYARRTGVRVVVVDAAGTSLIDTAGPAGRDFSTRPEIKTALAGARAEGTRYSRTLGAGLLYVAVPAAAGGRSYGAVRLTLDTGEVNALVHRYWLGLAAVAAVALLVMGIIGWAIARSVTRPLRHLTADAARFATGDLDPGAPDPGAPPEIAALAATMNTMAVRLSHLLAEQRRFVADASHQLRTPLTALRLRLENLQSAARAEEADDLGAAVDETARLADLVGDLLKFARAEESATPVTVDLAQLAAERVDTWAALAEAAHVTLDLASPRGTVFVAAVPGGVEQILDNLLDNAIAAAPADSHVSVTVVRGRDDHSFIVADQGPGLSDELKERAQARFWRLDHSRPGTGLGLPIADALATASGGTLRLDDAPGSGLAVTVTLPAAQRTPVQSQGGPAAARAEASPSTLG